MCFINRISLSTYLESKVDTINSEADIESDIWYHVNSGTWAQPLEGAVKMKFMGKIKCPIWQLLATTHAHCHKCGRLALTISYSAPHQSQKSKQSRQVIYSSGFCDFDSSTYSLVLGLVFFAWFLFSAPLILIHCPLLRLCNTWAEVYICQICLWSTFAFQIDHFAFIPSWQLITLTIWR